MTTAEDETAIRAVVKEWSDATLAGDLQRILPLMAEDVVFLVPGGVMRGRDEFAKAFDSGSKSMKVQPSMDVQEINVLGEYAYLLNKITVLLYPEAGGTPRKLSGNALSIFRKGPNGKWILIRDSNTVVPEK